MGVREIISKIEEETSREVKRIIDEAEKEAEKKLQEIKVSIQREKERKLREANREIETRKRIEIARIRQEIKKKLLDRREELIEKCFETAKEKLGKLPKRRYEKLVRKLMERACREIGDDCLIIASRKEDESIAESLGLKVGGKVEAIGGFIARSGDGKVSIDCTFDGIVERKKDLLREKVGKILFEEG